MPRYSRAAWADDGGRLAEASGLTTGAITGVADRLEKKHFVSRGADETDRRKTVVSVRHERHEEVMRLFREPGEKTAVLMARYSPKEQAAINDFAARTGDMILAFVKSLGDTNEP
jgi:DNA-binding MarR family transcriptional regulator